MNKWIAHILVTDKDEDGKEENIEIRLKSDDEGGYLWVPVEGSERANLVAKTATIYSGPPYYQYSPSDGTPGYKIAHEVNKHLGGQILLSAIEHSPAGTIH